MEILLLIIVLVESVAITYLILKPKPKTTRESLTDKEQYRKEQELKDFQALFNYNENIAVRGNKDE